MRRRNRGLSMVEIIVVMALMLLMMSILLPAAHKLIVAVHALGPQSHH
jgi:prepilin-type N-terminal cleavage/methylation domain-containing protein